MDMQKEHVYRINIFIWQKAINVFMSAVSGVSRVWQVGHVSWAPLDGGRHSTGLFLTYATRLIFLTVWLGTCKKTKNNIKRD